MPDHCPGLVVNDAQGMGKIGWAVIRPGEIAADDVLGPLKPFEADHRRGCRLGAPRLDCTPSKFIDLLPCRGRLRLQGSTLLRHPLPGVRDRLVEQLRIKTVDNSPCMPADRYYFFALP